MFLSNFWFLVVVIPPFIYFGGGVLMHNRCPNFLGFDFLWFRWKNNHITSIAQWFQANFRMFLRIGKKVGWGAIFLGMGWRGEVIILLIGYWKGGKQFSLGWRGSYFFEPRVSINAVTAGLMINGYDKVSIITAPLSWIHDSFYNKALH